MAGAVRERTMVPYARISAHQARSAAWYSFRDEAGMQPTEPTPHEYILAVIQGEDPHHRMVFASRTVEEGQRPIVLRQESFSPDIGWFAQSTIAMSRQEMVHLRAAMGGGTPNACQATQQKIHSDSERPAVLQLHRLSAAS